MTLSRRHFLRLAAGASLGYTGLRAALGQSARPSIPRRAGYGPLVPDPEGLLDLPAGFSYRIISRAGEPMDDGLLVPGLHDGMGAFPGPDPHTVILLRNHELEPHWIKQSPFGANRAGLARVDRARVYDIGHMSRPCLGGVTRLTYNTQSGSLLHHELALAGTNRNCAGGPTPWNSWISCEENVSRADDQFEKDHGYPFEVPANARGLVDPRPIKPMGRFYREAVAVEPRSGVVYQTEDLNDGLLYRYIPITPGKLLAGGRLQALAIIDRPSIDLRNQAERTLSEGQSLPVRWIDLDNPESPDDDLRYRGFDAGAARFARNEGIHYANDAIYIDSTEGGPKRKGQIWRYRPSPFEGTPRETEQPARLELWLEPNDGTVIENCDNLCIAPWGDAFVCEDGDGQDHLLRITPRGEIFKFARNTRSDSEFAGSCFSPDGSTLFFNLQLLGLTLCVTGPWNG